MQQLIKGISCMVATLLLSMCVGMNANAATSYGVLSKSEFKAYMSYEKITNTKSKQWELQQRAHTDEDGMRVVDGRYCVAIGSYFGAPIGTPIDVQLDTGEVLKCIVGDRKADADTDELHIMAPVNGNVVEFIVDTHKVSTQVRKSGTLSVDPRFAGAVTCITVYSDQEPEITNTVTPAKDISITQAEVAEVANVDAATVSVNTYVYSTVEQEEVSEVFSTYAPIDGMVIGN